jgi:hypothetical protein
LERLGGEEDSSDQDEDQVQQPASHCDEKLADPRQHRRPRHFRRVQPREQLPAAGIGCDRAPQVLPALGQAGRDFAKLCLDPGSEKIGEQPARGEDGADRERQSRSAAEPGGPRYRLGDDAQQDSGDDRSEDEQDEIAHPPDKQQQGQGGDRDEQPLDEEPVPWDEPSRSPIGCGVHPAAAGAAAREDAPASSELSLTISTEQAARRATRAAFAAMT